MHRAGARDVQDLWVTDIAGAFDLCPRKHVLEAPITGDGFLHGVQYFFWTGIRITPRRFDVRCGIAA
jgi:hypothetical protein